MTVGATARLGERNWAWALALTGACLGGLVVSYWTTTASMIAIWSRSDTFAHGFLVVPISVYLIWAKRKTLARLNPEPELFSVVPLAGLAFAWLAANVAGVLVAEQYAFVLMIPALIWAVLGLEIARALAFPLFFLLFAVPAGEAFTEPLMKLTAGTTVFMLGASGIPVYREGLFFTIPSGQWSIVEACSGLRYLIASITLGCVFAYLAFQSRRKRMIFIAASAIVPILANCARAYAIVLIAHLSDNEFATGADHLIYGWLFFGLVMAVLFCVGSRYRDTRVETASECRRGAPSQEKMLVAGIAAAAITASAPVYAHYSKHPVADEPPELSAPEARKGWTKVAAPAQFIPHFAGARASFAQEYRKGDAVVGLFVGYYRREHGEMIRSGNAVVDVSNPAWHKLSEAATSSRLETELKGKSKNLLVWRWYWVAGRYAGNPYHAKLLQAKAALLHGKDDAAVIVVYSPYREESAEAAKAMNEFLSDALPIIDELLERIART